MEIRRTKNVATYIVFPIVDADGDFVTSASTPDSEIDSWSDGAAPDGFTDCTNEATEIGTTGVYYLSLTQTECNVDYAVVQVKTATAGAKTQAILINFTPQVANTTQIAGSAVSTTTAQIGVNVVQISTDATAADNAEAFFDGTGYAGTNNVIPSVTTVTGNVNGNVGGNVTGSVGSLAAQAKADVNAEVVDALATDTYAEPGQEAPGATVSLAKKIGYLYKFARNKITQTSTTLSVFADDASTVDQKATVSDDATTYTRGEIGTGP